MHCRRVVDSAGMSQQVDLAWTKFSRVHGESSDPSKFFPAVHKSVQQLWRGRDGSHQPLWGLHGRRMGCGTSPCLHPGHHLRALLCAAGPASTRQRCLYSTGDGQRRNGARCGALHVVDGGAGGHRDHLRRGAGLSPGPGWV